MLQPTRGNFSGSVSIASANPFSFTLCVADGQSIAFYAVVQDFEGRFPGGVPNNSTVTRCAPVNGKAECCDGLLCCSAALAFVEQALGTTYILSIAIVWLYLKRYCLDA